MSKLILITGCTRGCGHALLPHFAEKGHTLIGCGRSPDLVAALCKDFPEPHAFEALDITDDEAVSRWAQHTLQNYGPPDILINNAALIHKPAPFWKIPANEFDTTIDANIKGTANTLRHFLPEMTARKRGIIVNFSSGWGRSTSPEVSGYCATKWAIEGLTQALSQEIPAGMAAVPLNPGIINTDMLRSCFGDGASHYPDAKTWAQTAAPFILKISPRDNGQPLSVPGAASG